MLEFKEVIRQWLSGKAKKAIARQLGIARNTVKDYIATAQAAGVTADTGPSEALLATLMQQVHTQPRREHGEAWRVCEARRSFIESKLKGGLKLAKVHRLLKRHGTDVPYQTLYRFAVSELDFGGAEPSLPVADCGPGEEVQLDTGWMTMLEPDVTGRRRRFRAWIFTSVLTRHRFVYAVLRETTESAIEACEAAWQFFGGVFNVLIPDNTKTIVCKADPLSPLITPAFLEYAQARDFQIDTARVRHPKDKARVERAVPTVREDCFRGEKLFTVVEARRRGDDWSLNEYGMRRHSTTGRLPLEHFNEVEKPRLKPAPQEPYDIPHWCDPKVGPDQYAVVLKALYSLPREYRNKRLRARADSHTVRFYFKRQSVYACARKPAGGRHTDPSHFPEDRLACANRDTAFLRRKTAEHGKAIAQFADAVLDTPLPWTRMRQVYALLGLCRRYGDDRVEAACAEAVAADMHEVRRLERMIKRALPAATADDMGGARVLPLARYLRPVEQYALPLARQGRVTNTNTNTNKGEER
jgi:transposase